MFLTLIYLLFFNLSPSVYANSPSGEHTEIRKFQYASGLDNIEDRIKYLKEVQSRIEKNPIYSAQIKSQDTNFINSDLGKIYLRSKIFTQRADSIKAKLEQCNIGSKFKNFLMRIYGNSNANIDDISCQTVLKLIDQKIMNFGENGIRIAKKDDNMSLIRSAASAKKLQNDIMENALNDSIQAYVNHELTFNKQFKNNFDDKKNQIIKIFCQSERTEYKTHVGSMGAAQERQTVSYNTCSKEKRTKIEQKLSSAMLSQANFVNHSSISKTKNLYRDYTKRLNEKLSAIDKISNEICKPPSSQGKKRACSPSQLSRFNKRKKARKQKIYQEYLREYQEITSSFPGSLLQTDALSTTGRIRSIEDSWGDGLDHVRALHTLPSSNEIDNAIDEAKTRIIQQVKEINKTEHKHQGSKLNSRNTEQYLQQRISDIEQIGFSSPKALSDALFNNEGSAEILCKVAKNKQANEDSSNLKRKFYIGVGLAAGAVAIASGVGAAGGAAIISTTMGTVAAGATIAEVHNELGIYQQKNREYHNIVNSIFSNTGDAHSYNDAITSMKDARTALNSMVVSSALAPLSALGLVSSIKSAKLAKAAKGASLSPDEITDIANQVKKLSPKEQKLLAEYIENGQADPRTIDKFLKKQIALTDNNQPRINKVQPGSTDLNQAINSVTNQVELSETLNSLPESELSKIFADDSYAKILAQESGITTKELRKQAAIIKSRQQLPNLQPGQMYTREVLEEQAKLLNHEVDDLEEVFRLDTRHPTQILDSGGIYPNANHSAGSMTLWEHTAKGSSGGGNLVSTSVVNANPANLLDPFFLPPKIAEAKDAQSFIKWMPEEVIEPTIFKTYEYKIRNVDGVVLKQADYSKEAEAVIRGANVDQVSEFREITIITKPVIDKNGYGSMNKLSRSETIVSEWKPLESATHNYSRFNEISNQDLRNLTNTNLVHENSFFSSYRHPSNSAWLVKVPKGDTAKYIQRKEIIEGQLRELGNDSFKFNSSYLASGENLPPNTFVQRHINGMSVSEYEQSIINKLPKDSKSRLAFEKFKQALESKKKSVEENITRNIQQNVFDDDLEDFNEFVGAQNLINLSDENLILKMPTNGWENYNPSLDDLVLNDW